MAFYLQKSDKKTRHRHRHPGGPTSEGRGGADGAESEAPEDTAANGNLPYVIRVSDVMGRCVERDVPQLCWS
jgi:hypothetical protein